MKDKAFLIEYVYYRTRMVGFNSPYPVLGKRISITKLVYDKTYARAQAKLLSQLRNGLDSLQGITFINHTIT